MWPDQRWEELRKDARRLEHDIDAKLVQLSKLGASVASGGGGSSSSSHPFLDSSRQQDQLPLLSSSPPPSSSSMPSRQDRYRTFVKQTETLLAQLKQVNDEMSSRCSNNMNAITNTPVLHTLQRHRDILQDYVHEFNKSKTNIDTYLSREELFAVSSSQNSAALGPHINMGPSFGNRRSDLLSAEHEHLRNSERHIDEQIEIASLTRDNLRSQRKTLMQSFSRMGNIKQRFPALSSLMTRIGIRKRQESLILGVLIGFCVIVLLWWKIG